MKNFIFILTLLMTFKLWALGAVGSVLSGQPPLGGLITCPSGGIPPNCTSGTYTLYTFTSSATFILTSAINNVDYLVVAGGGGGNFAGGGAGGVRTGTFAILDSGKYVVFVGNGGNGASVSSIGLNGGNSSFNGIVSTGGGSGGGGDLTSISFSFPNALQNGGSGGGGATGTTTFTSYGGNSLPITSPVQGYAGGSGTSHATNTGLRRSGGGGGAGSAGGGALASTLGIPGNGIQSSITGTAVYYGGGGAGLKPTLGSIAIAGGLGGGGSNFITPLSMNGTPNTGGGGGASYVGPYSPPAGNGGSGIVILRYLTP